MKTIKVILASLIICLMLTFAVNFVSADSKENIETPSDVASEIVYVYEEDGGETVKTPAYKYVYEKQKNGNVKQYYYGFMAAAQKWVTFGYFEFGYNKKGEMTYFAEAEYDDTTSKFNIHDEQVREFNKANLLSKRTDYSFTDEGERYVSGVRNYTYDEQNNLTLETFERRESATDELVLFSKTEYEYTNGKLTKETEYSTSSGTFYKCDEWEYTYDDNGNNTKRFCTSYDTDGEISMYAQYDHEYDEKNRELVCRISEQQSGFPTKNLSQESKYVFEYGDDYKAEVFYRYNGESYAKQFKNVTYEREGYYKEEQYEWNSTKGEYEIDSSSYDKAVYKSKKMMSVETYSYVKGEYVIDKVREFTYAKKGGNAGAVILVIFLVLVLLFVAAYVVWKFEFEGKLKIKENDRILKFADVVYKPIDTFLFTKVFKKKEN